MRIPTYDNYDVTGVNTQAEYQRVQASPDSFGSQVGQGMQQLGAAVGQAQQEIERQKNEMDSLEVENRFIDANAIFGKLDDDYAALAGKNALDGEKPYTESLQQHKQKILEGIEDTRQKMLMGSLLDKRINQSLDFGRRHKGTQFKVYREETYKGTLGMYAANAQKNYDDEATLDRYVRSGLVNIDSMAAEMGWPQEKTMMEKQQYQTEIYGGVGKMLATKNGPEALRWAAKYQDKMAPEIYGAVVKAAQADMEIVQFDAFKQGVVTGKPYSTAGQRMKGAISAPADVSVPREYAGLFNAAEDAGGLSSGLLSSMGSAESGFNPRAVGPATRKGTAVGIMQFLEGTGREYGLSSDDRTDPAKAIPAAGRYVSKLKGMFGGNEMLAVAAYNWGPGNVSKLLEKHGADATMQELIDDMPKETQNYLGKVFGAVGGGSPPEIMRPDSSVDFSYPPQTTQDLERYDLAMTQAIGRLPQKAQASIRSQHNAEMAALEKLMKARNDGADRLLSTAAAKQIEETGAVNLTELKLNPQIAQALEYATPSFVLSLTKEQEQAKSKRADEVTKQEKESSDEASNRVYMSRYGAMMADPAFAKSYNPARDPELTPSQMEKLWKLREDVTTRGEKQIANDPLHTNLKQGMDIFDDVYKASAGGALNKDYKFSEDYLFLQGVTTEAIVQAQLMNGGKVLSAEDQRKIAERAFVKSISRGYVYDGTQNQATALKDKITKQYPNATPQQINSVILKYMETQQAGISDIDPARLKNALQAKGFQ